MACDIPALLADANCFFCTLQGDMYLAAEVALLCAIRDGETVECTPAAVLARANCLLCEVPTGMLPAMKLALLCHIANGT